MWRYEIISLWYILRKENQVKGLSTHKGKGQAANTTYPFYHSEFIRRVLNRTKNGSSRSRTSGLTTFDVLETANFFC